jgi:hypothetical protein
MAHACNPTQEDFSSKPAQGKYFTKPYLKKKIFLKISLDLHLFLKYDGRHVASNTWLFSSFFSASPGPTT